MFKLDDSPSFFYPIKVTQVDHYGRQTPGTFQIEFRRLTLDQRQSRKAMDVTRRFNELLIEYEGSFDMARNALSLENLNPWSARQGIIEQADHLLEIVIGWRDVSDREGPMEFSRDNLIRLLNHVHGLYALINSVFHEALDGKDAGVPGVAGSWPGPGARRTMP